MNIGIIGAGNIAVQMVEAIHGLDESVHAYAIASRSQEKAQLFADTYAVAKVYGSYEELVQDSEVDLVYIATPHSLHYEHAKMCLEQGKPVLCEKAFTVNAAQARELVKLAQEKKILLAEAIWTRYMPSRALISQEIASGRIGKVTSLVANLGYEISHVERMQKPELAGGALLDLGVYPINFASMVMGDDIESIEGTCTKIGTGVDSQDSITITYKDGRMAQLFATMLAKTDRIATIHGERGWIQVENINNCQEIRVYVDYALVETISVPPQINGYEYEVLACQKALETGSIQCPEMPHEETVRMMEWMDILRNQWGISYPCE